MSMFDALTDQALSGRPELSPLRMAVEKELLHHDIIRILSESGQISGLVFMGGTCLRKCYGSNRLSEDLDFAGGLDFDRARLTGLAPAVIAGLSRKYGLRVEVAEPVRETGDTDTWRIKVFTRPERRDAPAQRINVDICAVPAHDHSPRVILNPYALDMGTGGLLIQAESREEIFADKLVAFALRPNRIKYRDLWDIAWLHQQGIAPRLDLVPVKLDDHKCMVRRYLDALDSRLTELSAPETAAGFRDEMKRFVPAQLVAGTVNNPDFWTWLSGYMAEMVDSVRAAVSGSTRHPSFRM